MRVVLLGGLFLTATPLAAQTLQPAGGNATVVVQDSGANLHVVCDSGCAAGAPGQQTMANSSPVVLASNQSAVPVMGTFWPGTQPVSGTFWQAVQPVSGTFFQATQPVSGSGNFTVVQGTGTNLHVVCDSGCAAGSPGQQTMAASSPVVIASNQSAIPVTLATAPTTPVTGTFWQTTQPVSGSFWQATQPVSIATMPSTPVTGTFWQATQPISAAALPLPTGAATETTLAALNTKVTTVNTGAVTIAAVPALTKGTQGATGFSTQDLKDAGRTLVTLTADAVTPAASETLITVAKLVGDTVTAGVTTYAVTSGKTLRIQGLSLSLVSSTTTVNKVRVRLRTLSSGACLATSPVVATWELAWPTAVAAVVANSPGVSRDLTFPDGLEFSGATRNVCLSAIAAAANGTLSVSLLGFEY